MVNSKGSNQADAGQLNPQSPPAATQFGTQPVSSTGTDVQAIEKAAAEAARKEASRVGEMWRKAYDALELKLEEGNPDGQATIRAAQEQRRLADENATEKQEAAALKNDAMQLFNDAKSLVADTKADALAVQYGVDKEKLVRFSNGNIDLMEEIAKELPKSTAPTQQPNRNPPLMLDNSIPVGGFNQNLEQLLATDISKMTPAQLDTHKKSIEAQARGMSLA